MLQMIADIFRRQPPAGAQAARAADALMTTTMVMGRRAPLPEPEWLRGFPTLGYFALDVPTAPLDDAFDAAGALTWGIPRDEVRAVREVLANGEAGGRVGRVGGFNNTFLDKHVITHSGLGREEIALLRPPTANAPGELFANVVAEEMGAIHMVPIAAARADGIVAMQFAAGVGFSQQAVIDGYALEHALRRKWRTVDPSLGPETVAVRAQIDRQLAQALDFITGNWDRHDENGIVSDTLVKFIDTADVGSGNIDARSILEPNLQVLSLTGVDASNVSENLWRVRLRPEVVELVRRVDRDAIRTAHEQLAQGVKNIAQPESSLQHAATAEYLDGLFARMDYIIEQGAFEARLPDYAWRQGPASHLTDVPLEYDFTSALSGA